MNNTKEHIKKAARDLFSLRGYDGVSVRDIAAAAEVNLSAVSYHFGGKEELYREVLKDGFAEVRGLYLRQDLSGLPLREKVEALLEAFFEFHLRQDSVSRIMMSELLTGGERLQEVAGEHLTQMSGIMRQFVENSIRNRELKEFDPTLTVFSFISLPLFLVFAKPVVELALNRKGYTKEFIREVARHTVRLLFEGLEAKEGEPEGEGSEAVAALK
jgi:AcrR family transcriptional regulator